MGKRRGGVATAGLNGRLRGRCAQGGQLYRFGFGYLNPNVWTKIEEGLFLRCQILCELNTCYIHDGEEEEPRRFGSMRDWRRVGDFMAWHHPTIVLVNAQVKKTYVFEVNRPPAVKESKLALRELRSNPTWLGFVCHGDESEPCFFTWRCGGARRSTRPFRDDVSLEISYFAQY